MKLVWIISLILINAQLSAREVDTLDEEVRIKGFSEHLAEDKALDRARQSGLDEHKKKNASWNDLKAADLQEYRTQKKVQAKTVDETGPEYREYLRSRAGVNAELEINRKKYIQDKKNSREKNKRKIVLSEEKELMIYEDTERVEWEKRKFFGQIAGAGGSRPSFNNATDFAPPPPPPGFFEAEPPPPPPVPFDPVFDNEVPPPPPMFEDDGF